MARNLSVFGSDNGLGRGVAANPFLMLHREMNRLFDDVFRSTPVPFDQSGEAISWCILIVDWCAYENYLEQVAEKRAFPPQPR